MTIALTKDQKRMIDHQMISGAYHNVDEVVGMTLAMLYEDVKDNLYSDDRSLELRLILNTDIPQFDSLHRKIAP